jgi:3-hydroxyacyl-[acyl-carrier-protein] dehydratase
VAGQPFLDFDRIDLTQLVATAEELQAFLHQRGRFAMLDGIAVRNVEENLVVGFKDIRRGDWWAPDHIPGRPLFPGVLMIETAAQLCSYDFVLRHGSSEPPFVGFGGVDRTRFRGTVEPDVRMWFAGRMLRTRSGTFIYEAQGYVKQSLVFETQVMGVALEQDRGARRLESRSRA